MSQNETVPKPTKAVTVGEARKLSFIAVNGWRGPGALAIAMGHFALVANLVSYQHLVPTTLLVDLFFVLSGLVIAQVYGEKLQHPSAFPEYIVRRFGRIWPVQAVILGILVGYELLKMLMQWVSGQHFSTDPFSPNGPNLLSAIPTNLLLIQSLGLHDRETWDFPSWSLSVEFATYATFAAVCLIRHTNLRRALTLGAILASLAVLIFIAPYKMRSTFDYGIFRCFAGFFAGTLSHDIAARWKRPRLPMPTLLEIGSVAVVVIWMRFSTDSYLSFAAPFVFCAFILAFMGQGGAVSAILKTKALQFLAELSFAIYMVHAVVLIAMFAVLHQIERAWKLPLFVRTPNLFTSRLGASSTIEVLHLGVTPLAGLTLLYGLAVLAAALCVYRFIEVPGRTIFGRLSKRVAAPQIAPSMEPVGRRSPTSVVMP